jgi:hypothetical protein
MSELSLGAVIEQLKQRGIQVAWVESMLFPGVFVREHGILVLAEDRSEESLIRTALWARSFGQAGP